MTYKQWVIFYCATLPINGRPDPEAQLALEQDYPKHFERFSTPPPDTYWPDESTGEIV